VRFPAEEGKGFRQKEKPRFPTKRRRQRKLASKIFFSSSEKKKGRFLISSTGDRGLERGRGETVLRKREKCEARHRQEKRKRFSIDRDGRRSVEKCGAEEIGRFGVDGRGLPGRPGGISLPPSAKVGETTSRKKVAATSARSLSEKEDGSAEEGRD